MAPVPVLKGRRILVKFGGNALSGAGDLERFGQDIAALIGAAFDPVLVHGGGPEISQEMEKRGLRVNKIAGLRVTDDASLVVAEEVLRRINSTVVGALVRAGVNATGMAGATNGTIIAEKMPPVKVKDERGHEQLVDLGNVGNVSHVNPIKLEDVMAGGAVPVIYPICVDENGRKLNVNADTVAAHVARAAGAEEMVLVSDVPGILRGGEGSKEIVRSTTLREIDALIASGAITGGMVPKVEAARTALMSGVEVVYMLNGKEPHSIVRKLVKGEECGTRITRG
jgi:acetylglutamate kinase